MPYFSQKDLQQLEAQSVKAAVALRKKAGEAGYHLALAFLLDNVLEQHKVADGNAAERNINHGLEAMKSSWRVVKLT